MLTKFDTIITTNDMYVKLNYLNQFELNYSLNLTLTLSGKYLIINKKALIIIVYLLKLISKNKSSTIKSKSNILNFNLKKKIIIGYTNTNIFKNSFFFKKFILENILSNLNCELTKNTNCIKIGLSNLTQNIEITYEFKIISYSLLNNYPGSYCTIAWNTPTYNNLYLYLNSFQLPVKEIPISSLS